MAYILYVIVGGDGDKLFVEEFGGGDSSKPGQARGLSVNSVVPTCDYLPPVYVMPKYTVFDQVAYVYAPVRGHSDHGLLTPMEKMEFKLYLQKLYDLFKPMQAAAFRDDVLQYDDDVLHAYMSTNAIPPFFEYEDLEFMSKDYAVLKSVVYAASKISVHLQPNLVDRLLMQHVLSIAASACHSLAYRECASSDLDIRAISSLLLCFSVSHDDNHANCESCDIRACLKHVFDELYLQTNESAS